MSRSRGRVDVGLRDAYLSRLALEAEPPSVEALQQLHRRQVERIPYETMWIQAGEAWGIDPSIRSYGSRCPLISAGRVEVTLRRAAPLTRSATA